MSVNVNAVIAGAEQELRRHRNDDDPCTIRRSDLSILIAAARASQIARAFLRAAEEQLERGGL